MSRKENTARERRIARQLEAIADGTAPRHPFHAALLQARDRHHARLAGQAAFDAAVRPAVLQ